MRTVAYLLLDSLCQLRRVKPGNTAIIVRLDAIGDFFMWLQSGAVEIAKHARGEGRHSVILANSAWSDYAKQLGLWDTVVEVDPQRLMRNPWYRIRLLWRIRALGAKMLIQPRAARVFLQEDAIARISGAAICVGNAGTAPNQSSLMRWLGDQAYGRLISVSQSRQMHETERNAQFTFALTGVSATRLQLRELHPVADQERIAVALGAGEEGRVWPPEKLLKLIRHASRRRPSWSIALLGSAAQLRLAREIVSNAGTPVQDQVGKTNLSAFVDAIATSRLTICNDTSAFHIAMALEKDVVCFLGGGHFGWFAPYPGNPSRGHRARVLYVPMDCYWCNWDCKFPRDASGAFACVAAISIESATQAFDSLLTATPDEAQTYFASSN
jgi:hypothetical protein